VYPDDGYVRWPAGIDLLRARYVSHLIEEEHMANRSDFTDDQWKELHQGVTGAGLLVSSAHRDFTDSFGEAKAVASQLAGHRDSESELVRELAGTSGTGFGLVASPKEVVAGTISALEASVVLLAERDPTELEAYRSLVLDVATAAAEAKGGVREEESAAIERIRNALGTASTT
jgi:hypothetical protein